MHTSYTEHHFGTPRVIEMHRLSPYANVKLFGHTAVTPIIRPVTTQRPETHFTEPTPTPDTAPETGKADDLERDIDTLHVKAA